jgi:hypothetical protein
MMVVIIRTKKIIIPIKAFKAMKRVYLILIAIHIGQAPNGLRFTCAAKRSGAASGASACWAATQSPIIADKTA